MKRKFLSFSVIFALILSSVFSLFSCGEKYEPVESTEEEERTVIEISYDGEEYEIAVREFSCRRGEKPRNT